MTTHKDLTQEPPRSPRTRIGDFAILGRILDKGRADLAGKIGAYNFACPLDQTLLEFKGVSGDDIKELLKKGMDDDGVAEWLMDNGTPRSSAEIKAWSGSAEAVSFHRHPENGEWFDRECARLGLDPAQSTLFDFLEADDRESFRK